MCRERARNTDAGGADVWRVGSEVGCDDDPVAGWHPGVLDGGVGDALARPDRRKYCDGPDPGELDHGGGALPPAVFELRLRPLALVTLVVRFLADVVKASLQVAWMSVIWWRVPVGRFVDVQLRATQDLPRTLTAELTSLVPGSLVVDLDPDTGLLRLHLFDVPTAQDVQSAVTRVLGQERRLLRALFTEEVT